MAIKIEKGVPLPTNGSKYPFAEMEVGDSFAVLIKEENKIRAAAGAYNSKHKGESRLSIRKLSDNSFRCWKVE
jgi:hypothetical protein